MESRQWKYTLFSLLFVPDALRIKRNTVLCIILKVLKWNYFEDELNAFMTFDLRSVRDTSQHQSIDSPFWWPYISVNVARRICWLINIFPSVYFRYSCILALGSAGKIVRKNYAVRIIYCVCRKQEAWRSSVWLHLPVKLILLWQISVAQKKQCLQYLFLIWLWFGENKLILSKIHLSNSLKTNTGLRIWKLIFL